MQVTRRQAAELFALFVAGCATGPSLNKIAVPVLAPTGKLRVGLYTGGPTNIVPGATPEESKGVGFDLGKELARRLKVAYDPVVYPNSGGVISGVKSGEWDIAFLAQSPDREDIITFSAPFLLIEHGYLVPQGSTISTAEAADRTGIRIGAPQGGSVLAVLNRTVTNAAIIPAPGLAAAAEMLKSGRVDCVAANKANLFELSDKLPGSRVLEGRIGVDQVTIAIPKGREAGMPYIRQFLENAKATGLVSAAIRRVNLRGAVDE